MSSGVFIMPKFEFDVHVTESDYADFNIFVTFKSDSAKKRSGCFNVAMGVLAAVYAIAIFIISGVTVEVVVGMIPMLVFFALCPLLYRLSMRMILSLQLKSLKKQNKKYYSPDALYQFFDEKFADREGDCCSEHTYSAIESVSVWEGRAVYLHFSPMLGHILPMSCFESQEQLSDFVFFIKKRVSNVNYYK